jgi:hypothetical protein
MHLVDYVSLFWNSSSFFIFNDIDSFEKYGPDILQNVPQCGFE